MASTEPTAARGEITFDVGDGLFARGMREHEPRLCWLLLAGERCCIQERGHDDGIHEDTTRDWPARTADETDDLAFRVATYLRGALAIGTSEVGDIEIDTLRASFTVEAANGTSVRVTVDDTTGELA